MKIKWSLLTIPQAVQNCEQKGLNCNELPLFKYETHLKSELIGSSRISIESCGGEDKKITRITSQN